MAANEFIVKLKADGSIKDQCDIDKVYCEYQTIANKLSKDRGTFALNVLCILCRNLEKVPSWRDKVDVEALLTLSIECVRGTRGLPKADSVKALACINHIHKHVVRMDTPPPPGLVLKLSYMPFENKTLLNEYVKTYWNIVADRINYLEKLKPKICITKLLQKLTEDTTRIIHIYDSVQFTSNILSYLVKKLFHLYSQTAPKELNITYKNIFQSLTKCDMDTFKTLNDKDTLDLYVKMNDCMYCVAENASKVQFKDSSLNDIVRSCITLLGHRPDIFHCLQTFYSNTFCCLFTVNMDSSYMETILNSLTVSCETTEKMGYENTISATYPFLNQLLKLFTEKYIHKFSVKMQEICLNIILFLMKKLKNTEQLLKCDNCKVKTGLHDSLRLFLLVKLFIKDKSNDENVLPTFLTVVKEQYIILNELKNIGCNNYKNYFMKIQTDIHNMAVKLNSSQTYKYSIELFDIYIKNELENTQYGETKNVCRALFNKSICESDYKLYEIALIDAYLSLIFAQNLTDNCKYMSLVMDIKAKSLKDKELEEKENLLQNMSVLEASKIVMEKNYYGNIEPFLSNLKFSNLLKHEYSKYAKMWPAMNAVAGVWTSLNELTQLKNVPWIKCENEDVLLNTLYEIILDTPTVVRTLNSEYYNKVITDLLERFENVPANTTDLKVIHATLLFMKAEFDLADASRKYNWKIKEPNVDPELVLATKTIPQEHGACLKAFDAVQMWTFIVKELDSVKNTSNLSLALKMAQLFVYQFLNLYKTVHGLQMANICCQIAEFIDDKEAYITNAGIIISHMKTNTKSLANIMSTAAQWCKELINNLNYIQTALIFLCDVAIFYSKIGSIGESARLVKLAQAHLIKTCQEHPEINLEMAMGRLLEAQSMLCADNGPSALTSVTNIQRHYISITNTGSCYLPRRIHTIRLAYRSCTTGTTAVYTCRALLSWRRARAACACTVVTATAHAQGTLCALLTNTHNVDDAQTKIDNRLKHILGLEPTTENQPYTNAAESNIKDIVFTPKQDVETMLDGMLFKKITSPSVPCNSVSAFKMPPFFKHNKCTCYACESPLCLILAAQMCGLESSMYYRAKEYEIAKNYFDGTLKCFNYVDAKLKSVFKRFTQYGFDGFLIDSVINDMASEFGRVKLQILIEAAFFELSQENYNVADDFVVRIHEILQECDVDMYMRNEINNLMITSAQLRKVVKLPDIENLEIEFESLKLSPSVEPPSTPINKAPPPQITNKIIVKDEEIPTLKRKVIKLNLDDCDEKEVKELKKPLFKIPVPVTSKPVIENITPRPSRVRTRLDNMTDKQTSKPEIIVTQPSLDVATPKNKIEPEFFTPLETPEQFFTPKTSVKTYAKKSLRQNIVKNLESDFSTPIAVKEKSTLKQARSVLPSKFTNKTENLKRATSPGKLEREDTIKTRSRRLRQPANLKSDVDRK